MAETELQAEASAEKTEVKLCSKCKKNPVAFPDSTNPWCKECKAAAQKKYMESAEGMAEGKGFALGVRAMREQIASAFGGQGSGMFSGYEIHDLVLEAESPTRD